MKNNMYFKFNDVANYFLTKNTERYKHVEVIR